MTSSRIPPEEIDARRKAERIDQRGNRPPERKPGDEYLLLGAIAGIVIGIIIGIEAGMPIFVIIGFTGGGVLGAWLGSVVKSFVMRRPKS